MRRTVVLGLAGGVVGLFAVWRRQRHGGVLHQAATAHGITVGPATLAVLRFPDTGELLHVDPAVRGGAPALVGAISGRHATLRDGIPDFVDPATLVGSDATWRWRYDRFAPFYDLTTRLYARVRSGGDEARVREYLDELEIPPGSDILEVSVGTGRNLHYLPTDAQYVGLDLSLGMLRRCRTNLRLWRREADLILGSAEQLPFVDGAFDVVFHVGGINFFNDPRRAVAEMVRVAKPGTKILVADETERVAGAYRRLPARGAAARSRRAIDPLGFVPADMLDVRLKHVARGELYCLTFRTPALKGSGRIQPSGI